MPVPKASRRPVRRPRPPRTLRPTEAEARYQAELERLVGQMAGDVRRLVVPGLGGSAEAAEEVAAVVEPQPVRQDAPRRLSALLRLFKLLRMLRDEWRRRFSSGQMIKFLGDVAYEVDRVSEVSFARQVKAVVGFDPLVAEPWLAGQVELFREQNVALIRTIPERYFAEIEGIVGRGLAGGTRPETMAKEIEARYGVSRSRARLIARDQVAKLHCQVDRLRQQQAGVTHYVWRTSQDERVRPDARAQRAGADPDDEATSHRAREGKVYAWDDPPGDPDDPAAGGHPGVAIQCLPSGSEVEDPLLAEVLFRRRYDGPLAEIVAGSGPPFRATPQHPVLTGRGWVATQSVGEGDHVFAASDECRLVDHVDEEHSVARVDDAFDALARIVAPVRHIGVAGQFHGDGSEQYEVEVVDLLGDLPLVLHAQLGEPGCERLLAAADEAGTDAFMAELGGSPLALWGVRAAADGVVRRAGKLLALLRRQAGHAEQVRLAAVAGLDAVLQQPDADRAPGHPVTLRDGQLAISGQVLGDEQVVREVLAVARRTAVARRRVYSADAERLAQVVRVDAEGRPDARQRVAIGVHPAGVVEQPVRQFPWSGHVYNLQTPCGWYVARGLVVRNCRCTAEPVLDNLLR